MTASFVAALHFLAAFVLAATVFCEWLLFSRAPTLSEARRIQRLDAAYGIAAGIAVIAGLLRVYYFEKGSAFYLNNPIFLLKIGLFALAGLLSAYPTVQFIRWRKATRAGAAPTVTERQHSLISMALRAELVCLFGIIVAASLMAKGVGL
jgi:putative membrane protein